MISLILSLIFTANANYCTPVLLTNQLTRLEILASKLSDKALAYEIELEQQGKQDFELVNYLGISLIPMSLEYVGDRPDNHEFIELWERDVWAYVLLNERYKRYKRGKR